MFNMMDKLFGDPLSNQDKLLRTLAKSREGKAYYQVLMEILNTDNLCLCEAVLSFMMDEPAVMLTGAYLWNKRGEFLVSADMISSIVDFEVPWDVDDDLFELALDMEEYNYLRVGVKGFDKRLKKTLRAKRLKAPYRYKLPVHIIYELFGTTVRKLKEEGFSEKAIKSLDESIAVCSTVGLNARTIFFEGEDESEYALSFSTQMLTVYSYLLTRVDSLPEDAFRAAHKLFEARESFKFPKANSEELTELESELNSILAVSLYGVIGTEQELVSRAFWELLRSKGGSEVTSRLMVLLVDNPVHIPIKGFEKEWEMAIEYFLSPKSSLKGFYFVDKPINMFFFLPPALALGLPFGEEILGMFKTRARPQEKEDILYRWLTYHYKKDEDILYPVICKLLEKVRKNLREKIKKEFNLEC